MEELKIQATVKNIETVTLFVEEWLETLSCPTKMIRQIDIAIDELFGNIAQYAYDSEGGMVTLRLMEYDNPAMVELTFMDEGNPFNPLTRENPDVTKDLDEREVGGLGIFMVRKIMDSVTYEYRDGRNCLTIRKKITKDIE